jgi:hypothetical protein
MPFLLFFSSIFHAQIILAKIIRAIIHFLIQIAGASPQRGLMNVPAIVKRPVGSMIEIPFATPLAHAI